MDADRLCFVADDDDGGDDFTGVPNDDDDDEVDDEEDVTDKLSFRLLLLRAMIYMLLLCYPLVYFV